jgi:adenosine 3'-phospho 5'-phosphosulfate transporter B2
MMDIKEFLPHLRCAGCGIGIIIMLGFYGVIQERVMSVPYGGELFKVSIFLVLCNRIFAVMFASTMCAVNQESPVNKAPLWKYFAISLSNVAATTCQYEALKWVSFPVQMLGKSFKMMPVMVWGILISQKSYSLTDWLVAAAVTAGVTEFLMTGNISAPHSQDGDSLYGLALLVGFLLFDGFTSTFQEKLFKEHQTSKYNQMLYINLGSAFTSIVSLLVTGGFAEAFAFCSAHPAFVLDASFLSGAAVGGQFFIYSMVKEFGALAFAATMNVRQVASIIVSYSVYSKPITFLQIGGLVLVFGALFYKSILGVLASREKQQLLGDTKEQSRV